ncbi:oxidoreductase/transition metal ion-binding protein [Wolffia australiana]
MAVVSGQSSPSSLQIRRGFYRSKPSSTKFLIRLPAFRVRKRQVRLVVACSPGSEGGDDTVSRSEAVESSADPFSGWSGEDSDEGSSPKGKFEGFVGVGLAGLLFTVGISFAALSFGRKNAGVPKELNPPTVQEEKLLDTDEQNPSTDLTETEGSEADDIKGSIKGSTHDLEDKGTEDSQASPTVTEEPSDLELVAEPASAENSTSRDDDVDDQSSILTSNFSDSSAELTDHVESGTDLGRMGTDFQGGIVSEDLGNSKDPQVSDSSGGTASEESSNFEIPVDIRVNLSVSDDKSSKNKDLVPIETDSSTIISQSELDTTTPNELVSDKHLDKLDGQLTSDVIETRTAEPLTSLPPKYFSSAGIPAPSRASSTLVSPGKIIVPAAVDQVQGQALAALQVLKVIEPNVEPGDICSRREYARWLVVASSVLSRNTASKVYPAMYIENITELAFDDVTPEDPDFPFIQGLAEAGLISSKLSSSDSSLFSPASPVSRQDLVSWKMALEKRQLPEVDRKILLQFTGYIDVDRISPDAWAAIVADLSSREHGIIPLSFGYTRLFQPEKPVTKAQAAIALTTGEAAEVVGEELARIEAESMADAAVAAHSALVAEVEQDLNASFERELALEKQKADAVEKLAQETKQELERLRLEREEENNKLIRGRAAVESEMEVLSKLRNELEQQLQSVLSNKTETAFERERILTLRRETEKETEAIAQLQYELEVERKALSMARSWAEEEAKRASEQAKALEEARERWERHGLKIVVEGDLRDEELAGSAWRGAGSRSPLQETIERGESVLEKITAMSAGIKGRSKAALDRTVQIVSSAIASLKRTIADFSAVFAARAGDAAAELRRSAAGFFSGAAEGAKRAVEEGVAKMSHKFKTS